MSSNRIKVGVRIRPFSSKETSEVNVSTSSRVSIIANEGNGQVLLTNGRDEFVNNVRNKNTFQFDWSFGPNSCQDGVYKEMCQPLIEKLFEGYNATFFACKYQLWLYNLVLLTKLFRWTNRSRKNLYYGNNFRFQSGSHAFCYS